MKFLPLPAFPLLAAYLLIFETTSSGHAQSLPDNLAPTQTRLLLAQASPAAAVSSQAVATQPSAPVPGRLSLPKKEPETTATPVLPGAKPQILDPLLDLSRPRGCQLGILKAQTFRCGEVEVFLPAGIYQQVKVVEGPQERTAAASADLKPQAKGWGYIRYLADGKIKVNGEERSGGLDVGVRSSDQLPLRVWYKKFNPPDDTTKALGFIFPPIMVAAGAGAWSSGNTLLPDSNPEFTENRNYFLKEPKAPSKKATADAKLRAIRPAEAAQTGTFQNPYLPPPALRSR